VGLGKSHCAGQLTHSRPFTSIISLAIEHHWTKVQWGRPLPFRRWPCFDPGMAPASARNVTPSLSSDPRDKLLAALGWHCGRQNGSAEYQKAPIYYDLCLEWHERLSADDKELVLTLADVVGSAHKDAAESMAASLPPASRCPL
jgi:hypothetical protein